MFKASLSFLFGGGEGLVPWMGCGAVFV